MFFFVHMAFQLLIHMFQMRGKAGWAVGMITMHMLYPARQANQLLALARAENQPQTGGAVFKKVEP